MAKDFNGTRRDIREYVSELKKLSPQAMGAFYQLSSAALAEGTLSAKTKELIALAIGVAQHCDGCIAFHTKNLKDLGATRQEIAEVLSMNIYMGGGPALMLAADALRAFDQASE
ncbi:hypothetical protein TDB9533_04008 [Thalassocella blandensis]|nr:hypothetical protein TDB9533_04008 [Thalassocella blandensis]